MSAVGDSVIYEIRESCGCGAKIRAHRQDVLDWRATHRCVEATPEIQVPPTGAESNIETNAAQLEFEDRIGFRA